MQAPKGKQGQIELMRLAWRYGGPKERFFAVFIPIAPLISPLVAFGLIVRGVSINDPIPVSLAAFAVLGGWPSIMSALYDCAYSEEWHRHAFEQGWIHENEKEYYRELMRFRALYGSGGHSPGQMRWGFAIAAFTR